MKKCLALILASTVLFTACGQNKDLEKQKKDLEKEKDKLQDKSKNLEKDISAET